MNPQRRRQVAAYRASAEYQRKSRTRSRAIALTIGWVRDEHPDVWRRFLDEAAVDVRIRERIEQQR
jgi:hypothetical protein